jgi:hypothetical protein
MRFGEQLQRFGFSLRMTNSDEITLPDAVGHQDVPPPCSN